MSWSDEKVAETLRDLLGPDGRPVAMHGAKPTARRLLDRDVDLRDLRVDTELAAYLLDPADNRYDLGELLLRYVGMELPESGPARRTARSGGGSTGPRRPNPAVQRWRSIVLVEPLMDAMTAQGMVELHDTLEVPLVRVLARMEHLGIGVDPGVLTRIRDELTAETDELREAVIKEAGPRVQRELHQQLREVLFDELGLTPQKKTKTGYSTDAQSLEKMRDEHPIVEHLLAYREIEKLRSTYGEGLVAEVGEGDRIRATFNQTVARTGRLSSDQPNLHNIPVRSERGRVFRTAFVAKPGHRLLIADYDQIELRCNCPPRRGPGPDRGVRETVTTSTPPRRRRCSRSRPRMSTSRSGPRRKWCRTDSPTAWRPTGLAQRLNIPVPEAAEILESYFEGVPFGQAVHGRHGRGSTRARVHRDALRPPPADPGAVIGQPPGAHGGGAPGR